MPKFKIDTDELYPWYSLEDISASYSCGEIDLSDDEVKDYTRVQTEFFQWQNRLREEVGP